MYFQVCAGWKQSINGGFQLYLIAGAISNRLMLNVTLALLLPGNDDGQAMLLAEPVRGTANLIVAALVGVIVLVICEADGIPNHMIMDVPTVNMGSQDKLIFPAQNFLRQFQPDLMGLLRRYFSGSESLNQMTAQILALVNGVPPRPGKFNVGGFSGAAIGRNQQATICLDRVADVVNGGFQGRLDRMRLCNCHISSSLSRISWISAWYREPLVFTRLAI